MALRIIHRVMGTLFTETTPSLPKRKAWIGTDRLQDAKGASERARVLWQNRQDAREAKRWKNPNKPEAA